MSVADDADERHCPVCGKGVLVDIGFDAGRDNPEGAIKQQSDSRQLESYSCGHQVGGDRLSVADGDRLDVERRTADEGIERRP